MDLSSVIDSLATTQTLAVTRRSAVAWVNGRPVEGPTTPLSLTAVVYPSTPDELQILPEGRRSERAITIVTKQALQIPKADTGGDLIAYDDETFEVQKLQYWGDSGNFWSAIAVKVTQ